MKYRPLISVVIPFHNASTTLRRCVDSIIAQTYRPLEIILVDDASTDASYHTACCISDANTDSDIRFNILQFKTNRGVAAARLEALKAAKGEYMYSIDADDYVDPIAVSAYVEASAEGHYDIVASGIIYEYLNNKQCVKTFPSDYELSLDTVKLDTLHFSLQTKLIRRSSLLACEPFAEGQDCWEDLGAIVRMIASGSKVKTLPTAYYHYVQTNSSVTRNSTDPLRIPLQRIEVIRRLELWMQKKNLLQQHEDFVCLTKIMAKANLLRPSSALYRHPLRHLRLWKNTFPEVNRNIDSMRRLSCSHRMFFKAAYIMSRVFIR